MFKKQNDHKKIALLLCICIIFVSLSGIFFTVSHANHHCIGHSCPVCLHIQNIDKVLKQLGLFLCSLILIKIMQACYLIFKLVLIQPYLADITPVSLKVRLDD